MIKQLNKSNFLNMKPNSLNIDKHDVIFHNKQIVNELGMYNRLKETNTRLLDYLGINTPEKLKYLFD